VQDALDGFEASGLGRKYPATVRTWRNSWEKFTPFRAFPPPVRRIIYTINAIESLNYQLRKIIKNRGHFPNDRAVNEQINVSFTSENDHDRALTVLANRRFLKAADA
jgi:putative transposase